VIRMKRALALAFLSVAAAGCVPAATRTDVGLNPPVPSPPADMAGGDLGRAAEVTLVVQPLRQVFLLEDLKNPGLIEPMFRATIRNGSSKPIVLSATAFGTTSLCEARRGGVEVQMARSGEIAFVQPPRSVRANLMKTIEVGQVATFTINRLGHLIEDPPMFWELAVMEIGTYQVRYCYQFPDPKPLDAFRERLVSNVVTFTVR